MMQKILKDRTAVSAAIILNLILAGFFTVGIFIAREHLHVIR